MELFTCVFGGVVLLVVFAYVHLTRRRGHLETLGIPVDKPFLFLGTPPFDTHKVLFHELYEEKFRHFGTKTYGRYEGITPVLVTIDTDIIKAVLVKNFDSFTDVLDVKVRTASSVVALLRK